MIGAYARGWFPMARPDLPAEVAFFDADPRAILPLESFRVPRSVRRRLAREPFEIRIGTAFGRVVRGCAEGREDGVWLSEPLIRAYIALHEAGFATSVESWRDGELAGGLFGVTLGRLFTSESMFHRRSDAGNAALVATHGLLVAAGVTLWDVQMSSAHVRRFGAVEISAAEYGALLGDALREGVRPVLG
jgi:leucyl/phenylalanyl-tRNA--protein transferase